MSAEQLQDLAERIEAAKHDIHEVQEKINELSSSTEGLSSVGDELDTAQRAVSDVMDTIGGIGDLESEVDRLTYEFGSLVSRLEDLAGPIERLIATYGEQSVNGAKFTQEDMDRSNAAVRSDYVVAIKDAEAQRDRFRAVMNERSDQVAQKVDEIDHLRIMLGDQKGEIERLQNELATALRREDFVKQQREQAVKRLRECAALLEVELAFEDAGVKPESDPDSQIPF
jgi:predicted RNase H-like nuclease (RuvC/YqgF family)